MRAVIVNGSNSQRRHRRAGHGRGGSYRRSGLRWADAEQVLVCSTGDRSAAAGGSHPARRALHVSSATRTPVFDDFSARHCDRPMPEMVLPRRQECSPAGLLQGRGNDSPEHGHHARLLPTWRSAVAFAARALSTVTHHLQRHHRGWRWPPQMTRSRCSPAAARKPPYLDRKGVGYVRTSSRSNRTDLPFPGPADRRRRRRRRVIEIEVRGASSDRAAEHRPAIAGRSLFGCW